MAYTRSDQPERIDFRRLGRIEGATNPESAELLADGEHVLFGNCTMIMGHPGYRSGQGLVYVQNAAFLSLGRIESDGSLTLIERKVAQDLTATLGIDILKRPAGRFAAGTAFVAAGGNPITLPGSDDIEAGQGQSRLLIVEPDGRKLAGFIDLNADSVIAGRYNGIDQPNGIAADGSGNLYFSDIPNSNPVDMLPSPVPSAIYRLPNYAIEGLADGLEGSADKVQRIEMPGWVNGLCAAHDEEAIYAVSCAFHCPVGGGIYKIGPGDFENGHLPAPLISGLGGGIIDGVGITRRGTLLASTPLDQSVHAFTPEGRHFLICCDGGNPVGLPPDFNVCYPRMLNGEPAILLPDLTMGGPPGAGSVSLIDFSGF